jgi:DHA3 family macrolide efflux protein-like MFS transporter
MRKFTALSAGLLVSVLGSSFTSLALAVWVFRATGSATQYGITLILNFLPGIVFAPAAGALVDRWNRRTILILSDVCNGTLVLGLALLYLGGRLELWHVFFVVGAQSLLRAIQMPAVSSVVILLAPREQVGRANGIVMLAQALGSTVGFAAAGLLIVTVHLNGVLLIDCATFVVNIVVLLFVAIPEPPRSDAGKEGSGRLLSEIRQGWQYLTARRAFVALGLFALTLNLGVGFVDALFTPMVLSFTSASMLGLVVAALGVGMVLGSVLQMSWGGPRRRVNGLAGFALPLGFLLCLGAVRPSVPLIAVAAAGFMFCFTIIESTARSVLQLEVEPDLQGRAFAAYNMLISVGMCAAYAVAGPLADNVAEPLLRQGGALAGTVGAVIGVGRGRGMAFLVLLLGVVLLVTAVVAYLQPDLRGLPDRPERQPEGEEETVVDAPVPSLGADGGSPETTASLS